MSFKMCFKGSQFSSVSEQVTLCPMQLPGFDSDLWWPFALSSTSPSLSPYFPVFTALLSNKG